MKSLFYAYAMCQSMFCAIPFPGNFWDEKARGKMLLFLPVIGLEIGGIWWLLSWLCGVLSLPELIRGLVLAVFPLAVTGFIHLDGYMDVIDAVGSWRSLERRREILKDSHVGSFAVIGLVLLVLAQFAFLAAGSGAQGRVLLFVPVVSRCCSALAVTGLRPMSTSQYAACDKKPGHLLILTAMLLAALLGCWLLCPAHVPVLLAELAVYALALRKAYRSLDGMNGDVSGYALTLSELGAVAVFALL